MTYGTCAICNTPLVNDGKGWAHNYLPADGHEPQLADEETTR